MNTNQLTAIVSVMQEKSFQKAATVLHYSRSTVLDQISSAEKELQVKLFKRVGRELLPTAEGARFALHAQAMLDIYRQAVQEISKRPEDVALRIVATETLGAYILTSSFSSMMLQHPTLELSVKLDTHEHLCNRLHNGEADIAFGFIGKSWGMINTEEFQVIPLRSEPVVFFANAHHPLAQQSTISIQDLQNSNLLLANKDGIFREYLHHFCCENGIQIHPKQYIDSGTLLKQLVLNGNYISIISRSVIREELENGTLIELPWSGEKIVGQLIAVFPKGQTHPLRDEFLSIVLRNARGYDMNWG